MVLVVSVLVIKTTRRKRSEKFYRLWPEEPGTSYLVFYEDHSAFLYREVRDPIKDPSLRRLNQSKRQMTAYMHQPT